MVRKLEIKIKVGLHIIVVTHVQPIFAVAQQEKGIYALRNPNDLARTSWYFFMITPVAKGMSKKKKWTVVYPSALHPVPHEEELQIPVPPESYALGSDDDHYNDQNSAGTEPSMSAGP